MSLENINYAEWFFFTAFACSIIMRIAMWWEDRRFSLIIDESSSSHDEVDEWLKRSDRRWSYFLQPVCLLWVIVPFIYTADVVVTFGLLENTSLLELTLVQYVVSGLCGTLVYCSVVPLWLLVRAFRAQRNFPSY